MSKKGYLFAIIISSLFLIAACSSKSSEEQIHDHLEEAIQQEEGYETLQQEIEELEQQEQEIFSQIVDLDMDHFDEIQELSQEAISVVEEKKEKLGEERESIESSEEEFAQVESIISDLEDENVQQDAENMFDIMTERYTTYYDLNDTYQTSVDQEKELYEMLQLEELEQDEVTSHLESLNENYEAIISLNTAFNELTADYNEAKRAFYEASDLNVNYEDEPDAETEE
ncbi:YkyA family protein [Oceanobacillus jeddahense]|uniref:YkyA family protein n=1 Tax=Oceanobacillus jeddahense TaxID=1462527 RepID=A0ABY5JRI9_9BACI|nr:YkyA family protein [Oceanobacillus jeddahense]UUI01676.1 YkyA family protein [Oceanobacillus jeddahense]